MIERAQPSGIDSGSRGVTASWGQPLSEVEIVYVTASRKDGRDGAPKRRTIRHEAGVPLPRLGESVIIEFDAGAPMRWIVMEVAHVLEEGHRGVIVTLAAPYQP